MNVPRHGYPTDTAVARYQQALGVMQASAIVRANRWLVKQSRPAQGGLTESGADQVTVE